MHKLPGGISVGQLVLIKGLFDIFDVFERLIRITRSKVGSLIDDRSLFFCITHLGVVLKKNQLFPSVREVHLKRCITRL